LLGKLITRNKNLEELDAQRKEKHARAMSSLHPVRTNTISGKVIFDRNLGKFVLAQKERNNDSSLIETKTTMTP